MSRNSKLETDQTVKNRTRQKIQSCPECGSNPINARLRMRRNSMYGLRFRCSGQNCWSRTWMASFWWRAKVKTHQSWSTSNIYNHDKGLSTTIDWHDRDIYGKSLSPGQKAQVYRLRKWQRRIRVSDATEREFGICLSEITKISNNLNLPKIFLKQLCIYRKAVKERLIRGRSIQVSLQQRFNLAWQTMRFTANLRWNSSVFNRKQKRSWPKLPFLIRELNYSIPPLRPSQYITKFSNQWQCREKLRNRSQNFSCSKRT